MRRRNVSSRTVGRLLLGVLLLVAAESGPLGSDSKVEEISVHPPEAVLYWQNARQTLAVTARLFNGVVRDVTAQSQFTLEPDGVVSVNSEGVVTGVSEGRAKLWAHFGGKKAVALFEVREVGRQMETSFLNDVAPILTQRGCAGSNCHGSLRGKNGFKLSLFTSRPDLDYQEILQNDDGRRVNLPDPENSLVLLKPTYSVVHGGGQRFGIDSVQYRAILAWLSSGAPYDIGTSPRLAKIEVHPKERFLVGTEATQQLVVTGTYTDGTRRDLTRRVQYSCADDSVASVNENGAVRARKRGETAIMIRTLGKTAVARVAVIDEPPPPDYPGVAPYNRIDELVFARLKKLNVIPSELSDDSIFQRRVFLDTVGVLPTPAETRHFLSSQDPGKRTRLIDDLLNRPEFSELWTMLLADLFQVGQTAGKGGEQMYRWLKQSVRENKPYDQLVRALLLGTGPFVFSPTANFNVGLMGGPEGMAIQVSQALLGVRLECARCHNHPFEQWTQDDFYGLAAFFTRLERKQEPYGRFEHSVTIRPSHKPTYDFLGTSKELKHPKTGEYVRPKFLAGPTLQERPNQDPREELAQWITDPGNPWFSRAMANRVWKHFMGRGLVESVDDFRVTNPPSNDALLSALAESFAQLRFDLRKLVRLILTSRTYQLSAAPNQSNRDDHINYSRFYLKRLMAEVLFDAMGQATEIRPKIPGYPPGTKAISIAMGVPNYFLRTFGKPAARDVIQERDHQPNVTQAMHSISGDTIQELLTSSDNIIDRVLQSSDWSEERRTEEIYLAALSRFPTPQESRTIQDLLGRSDPAEQRRIYQDLLWAILNSKEFRYVH